MPKSTTLDLIRGTQGFLQAALISLLPGLNASLAASVTSAGGVPPVFQVQVGDATNVAGCRLCTYFTASSSARTAKHEKIITVYFNIIALIPTAGDNTSANFEMARQASADVVLTYFDDDSKVLTPKIDSGLCGTLTAYDGERGSLVDTWPKTMDDKVTVVRGWQMPFSLSFSISN